MALGEILFGAGGGVTLILGAGKAVQWWVARRDAGKDPIPKQEAAVALADKGMGIMNELVDELREELRREREERGVLRAEMMTMRQEHAVTIGRLSATEQSLAMLQSSFTSALRFIERMLRWARDGGTPPPPTVPTDLADLIDPTLHD